MNSSCADLPRYGASSIVEPLLATRSTLRCEGRSMSVGRYAALAAVLAGGVCAALPFYKFNLASAASADANGTAPRSKVELQAPQIAVEARDEVAAALPSPASPSGTTASAVPTWYRPPSVSSTAYESPLPALPQLPIVRRASRSAATIHEPDFSQQPAPPGTPSPLPRGRRHRIVDGDSLPLLALRYLGDEHRAEEIARLNERVIGDPSLLPVGKEIEIPHLANDPSIAQ